MDLLELAASALKTFLSPSQAPEEPPAPPAPAAFHTDFPQFANLPVELRLKIWGYAPTPRIHPIHLHTNNPQWNNEEGRYEGYAPEDPTESTLDQPYDYPSFIPETEEEVVYSGYSSSTPRPHHILLTPCKESRETHCDCKFYPEPKSPHALPLPGVLLACKESREVCLPLYKRFLEDEYDTRGNKVKYPISGLVRSPPEARYPHTGLLLNPSTDGICVRANVASRTGVEYMTHLAAVVSKEAPFISKVVIPIQIGMPPFKFWSSQRFQYWKNWGDNGWWVPVRFLLKMHGLREVVLLRNPKEKMLPIAWTERTKTQWEEELNKVEDDWPAEWNGKMPVLRFADARKGMDGI